MNAGSRGEEALVAWLRRRFGEPTRSLLGDDVAFLRLAGEWALTVDSQIEGVHVPAGLPPEIVARRLLAVNLSDLAASGAGPAYALLALSAPDGFDHRSFFEGLRSACAATGTVLAGGDLARSPVLVATLTLIGRRWPRGRFLRRDAGRPGDGLWLGGTLGESALGQRVLARAGRADPPDRAAARAEVPRPLRAVAAQAVRRHLAPEPQLALSRWLSGRPRAAALDVSDGLLKDLGRLAEASGVGAEVDLRTLPLGPRADAVARALGEDAVELALGGGEDYVLLFALPEAEAPPKRLSCHRIGRLVAGSGLRLRDESGVREVVATGWDHLAPGSTSPVSGRP